MYKGIRITLDIKYHIMIFIRTNVTENRFFVPRASPPSPSTFLFFRIYSFIHCRCFGVIFTRHAVYCCCFRRHTYRGLFPHPKQIFVSTIRQSFFSSYFSSAVSCPSVCVYVFVSFRVFSIFRFYFMFSFSWVLCVSLN